MTKGANLTIKKESKLPSQADDKDVKAKVQKATGINENANNLKIRVLIKSSSYAQITHEKATLTSKNGLVLRAGKKRNKITEGKKLTFTPDDKFFSSGVLYIEPKKATDKIVITSLCRGYGAPAYRGTLELWKTAEGIIIVNELPVEMYLRGVVPSEMPSSYELEALKTQAVCARNYAFAQMQSYAYPEYRAHVDDSTSYQVYNNSKEQKSTNRAVTETEGEHLYHKNKIVTTYYFSTSCGTTTTQVAWGTKKSNKNAYLQSVSVCDKDGTAYEKDLPWYRWKLAITQSEAERVLELNTGQELGSLKELTVSKIGEGGVALQIRATGSKQTITVDTEYKIRRAFAGANAQIERADGSCLAVGNLLPSAFFTIKKKGSTYLIEGGGFGHGIGMSQNGANEMAKKGKTYREILQFFFRDAQIK